MEEPYLVISAEFGEYGEYGLEELVETIKNQWNKDEIFKLIKELSKEMVNKISD